MPPVVRAQLDYYSVLEIAPTADTIEVNAAFRRLAWRLHPDRNPAPGATVQFQDINEAHQVLSDPARRAEYDAQWHPRASNPSHRSPTPVRRVNRTWRRHRHMRAVLLTLFAMVFVSSAWAVIFTALTAAHSGGLNYAFDTSSPAVTGGSSNCGFSMEMFPVTYTDAHGHANTTWGADIHNCYGGSARIVASPDARVARASRFAYAPEAR